MWAEPSRFYLRFSFLLYRFFPGPEVRLLRGIYNRELVAFTIHSQFCHTGFTTKVHALVTLFWNYSGPRGSTTGLCLPQSSALQ